MRPVSDYLAISGHGALKVMEQNLVDAKTHAQQQAQRAQEMEKKVTELQRDYDELREMMNASTKQTEQYELLDQAMSGPADQPMRFTASQLHSGKSMWSNISYMVLKRERERRANEAAEFRAEIERLTEENRKLQKHLDRLLLPTRPAKMMGYEQSVVHESWKGAAKKLVADKKAAKEAGDNGSSQEGSLGGSWNFESWLEPLELHRQFAAVFDAIVTDTRAPRPLASAEGRQAFLYELGSRGSDETVQAMLRSVPLLNTLASTIWSAAREYKEQMDMLAAARERAAAEKDANTDADVDVDDPAIDWDDPATFEKLQGRMLTFGKAKHFFASFRDTLGSPATDGLSGMAREHVAASDAAIPFTAPNYNINTTSRLEWYLVADPDRALDELGLDEWEAGGGHTPASLGFRHVIHPTCEKYTEKVTEINGRLRALGDMEPMSIEHLVALRMYTGPIYVKYNFILRGAHDELSNDFFRKYLQIHCRDNRYPTTLLFVCLGINKLSALTKVQKVYRAPGGKLPDAFYKGLADGSQGGIEMGFMSTTTEKGEAMKYASYSGVPVILEVQQGMVARGADISWLSQFPGEAEVLFGPQTCCEVHQIRTEGAFYVVELRPSMSPVAQRNAIELQSDVRLANVLQRLRVDTSGGLMDKIDVAVSLAIGPSRPSDSSNVAIDNAKAALTRAVIMAHTAGEVATAAADEAEAAAARCEDAEAAMGAGQAEYKAMADEAKVQSQRAKADARRLQSVAQFCKRESRAVDEALRYSASQLRERKKMAAKRWKNISTSNKFNASFSDDAREDREKRKRMAAALGMGFP